MFALTRQEKQVILFLGTVALAGVLINFLAKASDKVRLAVGIEERLIKIDLNRASIDELVATRQVSEKLAQRIIQYRLEHGGFKHLEEIKAVKGIGESRYERFKELFFVG